MALPSTILPRYRSTYFQHIFGQTDGYSSGYYSYKWAEVLEADAFALFKEKGIFDRATANALRKLLEKGGSEDAMQAYVKFRGHKPAVEPLLKKLGLGG
jgi:peptidyl-dipeptidase Dcp